MRDDSAYTSAWLVRIRRIRPMPAAAAAVPDRRKCHYDDDAVALFIKRAVWSTCRPLTPTAWSADQSPLTALYATLIAAASAIVSTGTRRLMRQCAVDAIPTEVV